MRWRELEAVASNVANGMFDTEKKSIEKESDDKSMK